MGLRNGIIGWADVAVPDTDAGSAFYRELFGWDMIDGDGGEAMPYWMFGVDGKVVAGMGPLSPEQAAMGQPPAWSSYIIVDDADTTYSKALELGATPLTEVMDILDAGRMFFMVDPVGAAVGVWQSGSHDGAEVFNVPGAMTWNELMCRDLEGAKTFYGHVFGWETETSDMGGTDYTMWKNDGRANGGVMDMTAMLPPEVPAHWLTWFHVQDCDESTAKATLLGGQLMGEPFDTPAGRSAVLQDPFGAVFGVIAPLVSDEQPPR